MNNRVTLLERKEIHCDLQQLHNSKAGILKLFKAVFNKLKTNFIMLCEIALPVFRTAMMKKSK